MIDRFIAHISSELRLSPLTVENYKRDVNNFAQWFNQSVGLDSFDATLVSSEDIRNWMLYRLDTGNIKPASLNRELSSIKSFFGFLHKKGVVEKSVTTLISSLKTPQPLPAFVVESRMAELLDDIRSLSYSNDIAEQNRSIIVTLFYGCGIRLAELCSITLSHISDNALKIEGKGDKHRIIPLTAEVVARIERYKACCVANGIFHKSDDKLIVGKSGKPISRSTVQRIILAVMSEAGIQGRKSPHILRHTFATHLLNKGVDMREIQELMGHSTLKTTQHYTHNSIKQLQEAYANAHPHASGGVKGEGEDKDGVNS